jgi:putative peptide zinc metalloprotease protein
VLNAALLGRYESDGMTDERYLVRRRDGQVILLTLILYTIASKLDGHHDLEHVAADVSEHIGQPVDVDVISQVIDTKLKPLGIIAIPGEIAPAVPMVRADPVLSLTLKGTLLPARAVRTAARYLLPLYWSMVVLVALEAFVVADVWTFAVHGVSNSFAELTATPILFLPVLGLVVAASAFHELGHATACRKGGGVPGRIGYGIMVFFPAFYTDVTDAYRLGRKERVRTDLGGVYFNAIFIVALTGIYAATGYLPILPAIILIHFNMLQQMLPLIRLDGYYLLSDLVGVPDLFVRIGPMLSSWLPGRHDARGHQLQPRARRIVTAWMAIVIPALLTSLTLFIIHLPHFLESTWSSVQTQWTVGDLSFHARHYAAAALAAISMFFLAIPILGISALLVRIARKLFRPRRRVKGAHTNPHREKGDPCVQDEGTQAGFSRAAVSGPGYRIGVSSQRSRQPQPGYRTHDTA